MLLATIETTKRAFADLLTELSTHKPKNEEEEFHIMNFAYKNNPNKNRSEFVCDPCQQCIRQKLTCFVVQMFVRKFENHLRKSRGFFLKKVASRRWKTGTQIM